MINLIHCKQCPNQVLGNLTDNGLIIMRNRQGTTIIKAIQFDITCHCGYTVSIDGTTVIGVNTTGYTYTQ